MNQPRRKFLKNLSLTSIITVSLPQMGSFAMADTKTDKRNVEKGTVILFQGDSITDGNRGRNNDPNHIMGHGYAFSIASRLGADYPEKQYQFYNRGISGNKITDLAGRWQTDTLDLNPDILSILVGVNDSSSVIFNWEPVVSIEKYEEEYDKLLRKTIDAFPDIVLVLGEPFILKVGLVADNWEACSIDISKRQQIVRKLAEKYGAIFIGYQKVFDNACRKASPDYWLWDGVHPTVAAHELMCREWLKKVEEKVSFK